MNKIYLFSLLLLALCLTCRKKGEMQNNNGGNSNQFVSVTTQHNDNNRTGLNSHEIKLNTKNVNAQQFGKLFELAVDDQVYSQPLVISNLAINSATHNVVYIATTNNSVYAYDADNGSLLWQKNYTIAGMRPPTNTDMSAIGACSSAYFDFTENIGIVGTPVIDSAAQLMYFVARSTDGTTFVQHLHAVNIITGGDIAGSPVQISATYNGTGDGSVNNVITFDGQRQNQRQALTLVNGRVYVTWSSHCDLAPYHGWILGYNSKTLQQEIVYNNTPDGSDGGIWESGQGLAADDAGNLYVAAGNGTAGVPGDPTNLRNRGESATKLSVSGSTLTVASYFTPYNFAFLDSVDNDLGSFGSLLIPNSNYFFTGRKGGVFYLLDKDNMGGYLPASDPAHQVLALNLNDEHCQGSYYNGAANEYVYAWSENTSLQAFPFNRSTGMIDVNNILVSSASGPTGGSGAVTSVSSNGNADSTGILWAAFATPGCDAGHGACPGVLYAFSASNITTQLWSSLGNQSDAVGNYAKFSSPTIANGHVYLATFSGYVDVYGLK